MARKFLVNLDLNTNELQNAVIQNLSSAPSSGNKEGRIYYDSVTKVLRVWRNGANGIGWYDIATGGTAASALTLTGDVTGSASVDPETGLITLNTHLNVAGTTNQIVVQDVSNTTEISLADAIDIVQGVTIGSTSNDGYIHLVNASAVEYGAIDLDGSNLRISGNTGDIELLPDSNVVSIGTGFGELHLQKTEYWRDGAQQGIIAAQSDGSLRITGNNSGLQLETNSGDIKLRAQSGTTSFNNAITINSEGTITATQGNLTLAADSNVVDATSVEIHTTKVELWNGSNRGAILAHPSDGSLTVAATGWLHLESHDGGISIDPDNGQTTFSNQIRIDSNGTIETNNSDLTLAPDSNNVVINNNLVTDSIVSKSSGADTLYVNAADVVFQSSNVSVGGSGINGSFNVKDSNSNNVVTVDASTNTATFAGDVNIDGDLHVQGTLTAINKQEIDITDNTIVLNSNFTTGAPSQDAAIQVKRGSANTVGIVWSESNTDWTLTNDGSHYFAVARKFVSSVGDGSATAYDVVHNLGTRDVTVQVYTNSGSYDLVDTEVQMKDNNTVTIAFAVAPATNAYRVVIVG